MPIELTSSYWNDYCDSYGYGCGRYGYSYSYGGGDGYGDGGSYGEGSEEGNGYCADVSENRLILLELLAYAE